MKQLLNLSDAAFQSTSVALGDGSSLDLFFRYRPAVQRWSMDVAWGTFAAKGIIVTAHPNIMRQWRNVVPFGIGFISSDGADPFMLSDFLLGRVKVFVMDDSAGEVDATSGLGDLDYIEQEWFT